MIKSIFKRSIDEDKEGLILGNFVNCVDVRSIEGRFLVVKGNRIDEFDGDDCDEFVIFFIDEEK